MSSSPPDSPACAQNSIIAVIYSKQVSDLDVKFTDRFNQSDITMNNLKHEVNEVRQDIRLLDRKFNAGLGILGTLATGTITGIVWAVTKRRRIMNFFGLAEKVLQKMSENIRFLLSGKLMGDNIYAPLTPACVRTLTDKLYEKRKAAALEIEKLVREFVIQQQLPQIERVLEVLSELARSNNPHSRKGGLIGLAAAAIALGRLTSSYTSLLIKPVIECFSDSDSRVRYYACEALYNIVKVAREAVMPHFAILFDTLCRLSSDSDQNVRNGSELLDRLLKDIVTSSSSFQLADFMCLLKERIYTRNAFVRQFLISWLQTLYTVPELNLLPFLPEILDGCFQILSEPAPKLREMCEAVLGEFLKSIANKPQQADLPKMVNILIVHSQAQDDLLQYIALVWLKDFLTFDGLGMLEFASGLLTAILPCLSFPQERKNIKETAKTINFSLMKLVTEDTCADERLDLVAVVVALQNFLDYEAVQTRVAVLRWIHHLYQKIPAKIFPHMEDLFPRLLKLLTDPSDEVVLLDLEVLSDMCADVPVGGPVKLSLDSIRLPESARQTLAGRSPYFVQFLLSILDIFKRDLSFLVERGSFVIRQLCVLLKGEQVLATLAVLLTHETDLDFASLMAQSLNTIMLTATELFSLREQLKALDTKEACDLFTCLYRCWCHHPIAVLALCLLSQNYTHAENLMLLFADMEVTVDFLVEIDKLVQLLESPIFTYLRLHLLHPDYHKQLSTVLYGLQMMLPQSEAFHVLSRRLQCLPLTSMAIFPSQTDSKKNKSPRAVMLAKMVNFEKLLEHYQQIRNQHNSYKNAKQRDCLEAIATQSSGSKNA